MTIDLKVPTRWDDLTQEQLRFLFDSMVAHNRAYASTPFRSASDYSQQIFAMVAVQCILHWQHIRIICRYGDGYLMRQADGTEFAATPAIIAGLVPFFDWVKQFPDFPVRLNSIGKHDAVPSDVIYAISFEQWLACENYWQRFQADNSDEYLLAMAQILYESKKIKPTPGELLGVFYWWGAVKNLTSSMFPNFFRPADAAQGGSAPQLDFDTLRRSVDSQIRALTKGDITKEKEILSMSAARALTELDALAREYEEMNRKYGTNKK